MRLGRWAGVATTALAVAVAVGPGAAHHLASAPGREAERTPLVAERVGVGLEWPTEVAITPPEELAGEVATPAAPAPTFAAAPVEADGEVFALLVGINDYPGRRADLRSAVADVETIDAALDGFGVPDGNRVLMTDGQATEAEVTDAIRSLVTQGGPGATYVFAYAGHTRKLDSDTQAMVLADGELLRDTELAALVAPATTQRMWFLLATCYAAGFTEVLAPGRVITAASGANELAWEDPSLNGSYLVHYLIRRGWLEGNAGDSVQEAFEYADAALARERPNRRPVLLDQVGAPLVLGSGDPTDALDMAPPLPSPKPPASAPASAPSSPNPPPSSPPPPSAPPPEEECFLLVLC